MTEQHPKHDSLFKWLITTFCRDYFAHYFPTVPIGNITFIDKEFISKYEAYQDSIEADLLLVVEAEIAGELTEVVVCIEHKSWRTEVGKAAMRYAVMAWSLRELPVWSIIFFTDDGYWDKEIADRHWFAFAAKSGKQHLIYDIIKLNSETSADLLAEGTLFSCLLALKANQEGCDRESIVINIYSRMEEMGNRLTDDHKLLVAQFVDAYSKVPKPKIKAIQEQVNMGYPATTITEFYENIGEARGRLLTRIESLQQQIASLKRLHKRGELNKEILDREIKPLHLELKALKLKLKEMV